MSVSASFLRSGTPSASTQELSKEHGISTTLGDEYSGVWTCVVSFARRWSEDMRHSVYFCPGALMLFGTAVPKDDATLASQDSSLAADHTRLRLLHHEPLRLSCQDRYSMLELARHVVALLRGVLDALPAARRPKSITIQSCASSTHADIRLFSHKVFLDLFYTLLQAEEADGALNTTVAPRHDKADTPSKEAMSVYSEACLWAIDQHAPAACKRISETPSLMEEEWAALLSALYNGSNPEDRDAATLVATLPFSSTAEALGATAGSRLPPLRLDSAAKRPKAWLNITLKSVESGWNHIVLLQPSQTDRVTSDDGIVTGAVQPSGHSFVVYLHQDLGDVLFVRKGMMEGPIPVENYDDLLPTDGAVRVYHILRCLAPHLKTWEAPTHTLGDCKSCFPWPVPHVGYLVPTGTVMRRTPVENPSMQVVEQRLGTAGDSGAPAHPTFAQVEHAFRFVVRNLIATSKFVTLAPESQWHHDASFCTASSPTAVACAWCGREREKLLRCGGCKAVHYCTKQHQALDWKGSHKGECPTWRQAAEAYESVVRPALASRRSLAQQQIEVTSPARDAAGSDANTIIDMLRRVAQADKRARPISDEYLLVHLISEDLNHQGLEDMLASTANRQCDHGAATCWTSELEQVVLAGWGVGNVRIVVCSRALEARHRNVVMRVDKGQPVAATVPSSGKLGDYWHASSLPSSSEQPAVLIRLFNEKYHNFLALHDAEGHGTSPHITPDVLLVLGDAQGHGMSFFSAAAEVIGDSLLGNTPVACSDASLVAAGRTWAAILQRRTGGGQSSSKLKASDVAPQLNVATCAAMETVLEGSDVRKPPVPLHRNLYVTVLPAV